jgi:2-amino-4-hydroxy-6-hydroxymethyldihydropteridine diphosphokinase
MIYAIVALGSNLGDSRELVSKAMDRLQEFSDAPLLRSSLWASEPIDCPPGAPLFVNAVVALVPRPAETPDSLLTKLQRLEIGFGRQPKKVVNESRPLDLDLIAFGDEQCQTPQLQLPHPRTHLRRFVLAPLAEIAPDLVLPGQVKPVRELLREIGSDQSVRRL